MPSPSRLVASTRRAGQPCSSACESSAHAPSTCSQLSRSRRACFSCRCRTSVSASVSPGFSLMPTAVATDFGASAGSVSDAKSANQVPSGYACTSSPASSIARRVLPQPPAPVSVSSRVPSSSSRSSLISRSRPTKLVTCVGRLCGAGPGWATADTVGTAPPAESSTLRMRSRSSRRWPASLARHSRSSSRSSPGVVAGSASHAGSAYSVAAMTSLTFRPVNAGWPARHSKSRQPNDQMSARWSTSWPRACSGLM